MSDAWAAGVDEANGMAKPSESMLCILGTESLWLGSGGSIGALKNGRYAAKESNDRDISLEVSQHVWTLRVDTHGGGVEIKVLIALER